VRIRKIIQGIFRSCLVILRPLALTLDATHSVSAVTIVTMSTITMSKEIRRFLTRMLPRKLDD
jgi:hypothetical protein